MSAYSTFDLCGKSDNSFMLTELERKLLAEINTTNSCVLHLNTQITNLTRSNNKLVAEIKKLKSRKPSIKLVEIPLFETASADYITARVLNVPDNTFAVNVRVEIIDMRSDENEDKNRGDYVATVMFKQVNGNPVNKDICYSTDFRVPWDSSSQNILEAEIKSNMANYTVKVVIDSYESMVD